MGVRDCDPLHICAQFLTRETGTGTIILVDVGAAIYDDAPLG